MNGTWLRNTRTTLVGLIGAAMLFSTAPLAQADQGKWWTPKEGPRGSAWRGARVHRDVIVIRDGRRGHHFRARRLFIRPRFHRHVVFVRPIRYFIAADACIGGVGIHARIRPHYLYGCNFCDARFDSYRAYRSHVLMCDDGPHGYTVAASDWDGDRDSERGIRYGDEGWHD